MLVLWVIICCSTIVFFNFIMDLPKVVLLTPYYYHEWRFEMEILLLKLRKPTSVAEKRKLFDRRDEALGTLIMSICRDLRYHVVSCKTPNEIWTTLESLFGKPDKMRKFKLENELMNLNPRDFDNI